MKKAFFKKYALLSIFAVLVAGLYVSIPVMADNSTSVDVYVTDDGKLVDPSYTETDFSQPYSGAYAYYLKIDAVNGTAILAGVNNQYFIDKEGAEEYDLVLPGEINISGTVNDEKFSQLKVYEGTYKITEISAKCDYTGYTCKSITFPEGEDIIKITSGSAFYGCGNLTSVTIHGNMVFTSNRAFENCVNLTSVTILDGFSNITNQMFAGCKKLENVNIPNTVTSIGDQAFMNCKSLVKINGSEACVIPDSVTSIGEGAFGNCGFTTVTLPKDLSAGWGFFSGLYLASLNLTEIKVAPEGTTHFYAEDGVLYSDYNGKKKLIAYPSGKTKKEVIFDDDMIITRGAFADNPYIENITFNKSVEIEPWAMYGSNLAELNDPEKNHALKSVTFNGDAVIYSYGFTGCELLTDFVFDDDTTVILENGCIKDCNAIKSFTFPKNYEIRKNEVYEVGYGPFYRCSNIETIKVYEDSDVAAASGTGLDARYFFESNSFTKFDVIPVDGFVAQNGKGCSVDEKGVLYDSTKSVLVAWPTGLAVDDYEIPATTSSIKEYAFYTVKGPKALDTGEETESAVPLTIGSHAFDSTGLNTITMDPATDTCLETVKLTSRVKEIGEHCFDKCLALEEVIIEDAGITELPRGAFRACTALKELILPDSITKITGTYNITGTMDGALNNCSALEKLVLPSKIGTLEQRSIYGCTSLEEIAIPESVGTIEAGCFMQCDKLSRVTFMNKGIMTIANDAFSGVGSPTRLESCVFVVGRDSSAEQFVKEKIAKAEEDYIKYSQSYKDIDWSVRYIGESIVKFYDYMNGDAADNNYLVWEGNAEEGNTLADILPEDELPAGSGNSMNEF